MTVRALELFAGIGGFAAAAGDSVNVVCAIDQDADALATYAANLPHPVRVRDLHHARPDLFAAYGADLWWMSPPCTPHTVRGRRRDLDDPRSAAFRAVAAAIGEVRPRMVAMENVPGFETSAAHALLRETLDRAGYAHVREWLLSPLDLGVPTERVRLYLVASLDPLAVVPPPVHDPVPLSGFILDVDVEPLRVPPATVERYAHAMHVVDPTDPLAVTSCFTAAYGRSAVRSGSYLRQGGVLRRFAPEEIAALLGRPPPFRFAPGLSLERRWHQVGNSVSVDAVRHVLRALLPLG